MDEHEPELYDNIFNFKNAGKRIYNMDDLHEGQKYVLDIAPSTHPRSKYVLLDDIPVPNSPSDQECGILIHKYHDEITLPTQVSFWGLWFRIGIVNYNGTKMEDRIHTYHWPDHIKTTDMRVKIYEYYLDRDLQTQIRLLPYYKKTVKNICSELNICEDIERMICRYL